MSTLRERFKAARTAWVLGRNSNATPHDSGPTPVPLVQVTQQSHVQTLFQGVTALTAVAAVLFTGQSLRYTADSTQATQAQIELSAKGQIAERFNRAVDQLNRTGKDALSLRLGGIYALERIMHDSPDDEPMIIEILCAFVRTDPSSSQNPNLNPWEFLQAPEDVRAAIAVLARRPNPDLAKNSRVDLNGTNLSLSRIFLPGASLRDVELPRAYLERANLRDADLRGADLAGAHLGFLRPGTAGADLTGADLRGASLWSASLVETDLQFADLREAQLEGAKLTGAKLHGANISTAKGLTYEMLSCALMDDLTQLPPGMKRPPPVKNPWKIPFCQNVHFP
ncbi:pentapeptide repeat-containing protein [Micromonospora echinospora]|uniref:pentapeptide repeat-containing protein n=1 Tax=Micromonospora echinospora TaxID=1877 RepID=UPI0033C4DD20